MPRGRNAGRRKPRAVPGRGGGYAVPLGSGAGEWVDPFPWVKGTKPEKMVLAELYRRRIPFAFQYRMGDMLGTDKVENWRVDFYIPSTRTVIEVYGDYWHTLGDQPFTDAWRTAVMEFNGFKVLIWWESEILTQMRRLFDAEPTLVRPPVTGPPVKLENNTDDLRAMRVAAARRARRVRTETTRRIQRRRKRRVR